MPPCSWPVPPCCFEAGYGPESLPYNTESLNSSRGTHRRREVSNFGGDRSGPWGSGGRKPPSGVQWRSPWWGYWGEAPKKISRKMLIICLFSCKSYTRNIIDQKHHCNFYIYPQKLVGIIPGIRNFGGDKSRYPPARAASGGTLTCSLTGITV